jgi:G3E family GTPase
METNPSAIPFHIVSGFLGSGKTTFLKEILCHLLPDQKTGVIQNEFAPANVDGVELKNTGTGFNLLEINNGSVFCVCLLADFITSLHEFINQYAPDLIIMEASGLSDTTSIAEILSHSLLSGKIYLASNWCIVDAAHFLVFGKMQQRIIHQIRMADVVIINKADLAGEHIPEIRNKVEAINPFAEIVSSTFCRIPFTPDRHPVVRYFHVQETPLSRPDIHSMVIKTTRIISLDNLKEFLCKWTPFAYRIKGYVITEKNITMAVQCLPGQISVRKVDYWSGSTELIALSDQFTLREWNRSFGEFQK